MSFLGSKKDLKINRSFIEASISEGKDMNVIRTDNSLICSLSISELERRFLANYKKMKNKLKKKPFPVTMCNFRTHKGANVFHFLIKDYQILERFYQNYAKLIEETQYDEDKSKYIELFMFILYPNYKEISPFDIGTRLSPKEVDVLLNALNQVTN